MLHFFRKNTKSIVWAVVVAFIAWGGYSASIQLNAATRSPGKIFGKEVSYRDYLSASRAVQIFTPAGKEEALPSEKEIEVRTWQFLVLSHEAKRQKIHISDDEVRQEITRLLGGSGSELPAEQYFRLIQNTFRQQPHEFEDLVRKNLAIRKLLDQVRQTAGEKPDEKLSTWMIGLMTQAKIQIYNINQRSLY